MPSLSTVDHAAPTTFKDLTKPEDMVTHGRELTTSVKGSSEGSGVVEIQNAVTAFDGELDNLEKDNATVADLQANLKAATKKRGRTNCRCLPAKQISSGPSRAK